MTIMLTARRNRMQAPPEPGDSISYTVPSLPGLAGLTACQSKAVIASMTLSRVSALGQKRTMTGDECLLLPQSISDAVPKGTNYLTAGGS
jgi:hypothetical protein